MKTAFVYPANFDIAEDGITVQFPDLPEAITQGEDEADALCQAADCLEEAFAARLNRGLPIPSPSRARSGQRLVAVPAQTAAKAALAIAVAQAGVSNLELARRLSIHPRELRRMLDPRHPTKLPRITEALRLLGRRLVVGVEAA